MKASILRVTCLLMFTLLFSCQESKKTVDFKNIQVEYPKTKKDLSVEDDYHGKIVKDPYRWLEDDHSEETKSWVNAQNEVTFAYLDSIPYRNAIKDRLTELWDYEKFGTPFKRGKRYYQYKNDGLQNQSILYSMNELDGEASVFLDPNKLSDDGTSSIGSISFDKEGKYMAYQVSEGGSDWRVVSVRDVEAGVDKEDRLEWIKFSSMAWAGDGFYYSRYPTPEEDGELSAKNEYHKVYYHKIGDDQSKDQLIYQDKNNPQRNFYAATTDDEDFLIIGSSESTSGNALSVKSLKEPNAPFIDLVTNFENDYQVLDFIDERLLVLTNLDAPNQKVVSIDLKNPEKSNWKDLIPESENALRGVSIAGNKLFANYLHNASSQIKVFGFDGTFIQDLELPGIGSVGGPSGKKGEKEAFFNFSSYTRPNSVYKLDTDKLSSTLYKSPDIKFELDQYETNQLWFTSKDGTKVPMFVVHKKGLELDGKRPTLLYGYGGFDIPLTPGFRVTNLPLLENDGVYVVANIRGGGEFGSEWHKSGTLDRKQNVFDDFIAAAEHLIKEGYTSSEKLAIQGGSNGGLLVGACMTQRPDLYQVAFPAVGVLDMLRYHKFTIGWAWATDYGRSDDPDAFEYLIKYSPLHNVKEQAYPATMVTTADHDDRVVPAHSFKFISELQDKVNGELPTLIRIETSAGHGAGKPTSKRIEEAADILSFMLYNMKEDVIY